MGDRELLAWKKQLQQQTSLSPRCGLCFTAEPLWGDMLTKKTCNSNCRAIGLGLNDHGYRSLISSLSIVYSGKTIRFIANTLLNNSVDVEKRRHVTLAFLQDYRVSHCMTWIIFNCQYITLCNWRKPVGHRLQFNCGQQQVPSTWVGKKRSWLVLCCNDCLWYSL